MYIPSLGGAKSFAELIDGGMITQAKKELGSAMRYKRVKRDIMNPESFCLQSVRVRRPSYKLITLNNSSITVPKEVYNYYIRKKQLS